LNVIKNLEFEIEHLDRYAIIDEPCTIEVKVSATVKVRHLYTADLHSRWLVPLRVITRENLEVLKELTQIGTVYYKVKNSWSEKSSPYGGFFYASNAFVGLKTVSILIHKDALSQEMKDKLGL